MINEPLWMPQGSVRALITLILLVGTLGLIIFKMNVPTELWTLDSITVTFYFAGKKAENGNSTEIKEEPEKVEPK
jgi:hypothetical protein